MSLLLLLAGCRPPQGALLPLAKSLALAWAPDGINVNVVLPGASNTPFTKVRSSFITVSSL